MRRAILVAVGLSWLFAMLRYPGWSSFDPVSTHFDPRHNFVCDLLSAQTPDGRNNTASAIAMNAAVLLLVTTCLLPIWWRHGSQVSSTRKRVGRTLGVLACCATLVICIEQVFALPLPHGPLTLLAGVLALVPTTLALRHGWRQTCASPLLRATTLGLLLAAATNFASYAFVQFGGTPTPIIPTSQNAALLLLLVWLWLWMPRPVGD